MACACHGALHTAGPLQGPGCRCVWGVICSDSVPSGAYQAERRPVILEVCEGGLCGPSVHALKANVLPSTTGGKPYTLLPISSDSDIDRGSLHLFGAATIPIASREGCGSEMPMRIKQPPCFGSLKRVRTELLWEPSLLRGPLWKNTHFIERNASGVMVPGHTGTLGSPSVIS